VRAGRERVDELEDLWAAMHQHHAGLPDLPPTRPVTESWRRRKEQYVQWLAKEGAHLLIAEVNGRPIGYAIVRLEPGPPTWDIGECVAELESLSVAADARGDGVGTKLLASARALAQEAGAARLLVSVAHSNAAAIRFYQREGFEPFYVLLSEKR